VTGLRIAVGSMGLISGARNVQVHGEAAGDDKLGRGAVQLIGVDRWKSFPPILIF